MSLVFGLTFDTLENIWADPEKIGKNFEKLKHWQENALLDKTKGYLKKTTESDINHNNMVVMVHAFALNALTSHGDGLKVSKMRTKDEFVLSKLAVFEALTLSTSYTSVFYGFLRNKRSKSRASPMPFHSTSPTIILTVAF